MRVRFGIVVTALLVAVSLAGCGGDDEPAKASSDDSSSAPVATPTSSGTPQEPSTDLTEVAVPCKEFESTAKKIVEAQQKLYSGSDAKDALDALVAEFDELKKDAPDDVKKALDQMSDAFRTAQEILTNPTEENQSKLAEVAPKIQSAGAAITAYVTSKCKKG